jgi:hypothetical protein
MNPAMPMLGQVVSTALFALGIYMLVMLGNFTGARGALTAGLSGIAFFVIPINSGNLFFKNKSLLFLIEAGYQAIGALLIAFILALWQ